MFSYITYVDNQRYHFKFVIFNLIYVTVWAKTRLVRTC